MRHISRPALIVLIASAIAGCAGQGGGEAQCAPPRVEVSPDAASPGETVHLTVENYREGDCADDGASSATRISPSSVQVMFRQKEVSTQIGELNLDNGTGSGEARLAIPEDAAPGEAHILVGSGTEAAFRVVG